ncbi:MAG: hypothetical protein QHC90_16090 [Shinella sp.]|nr:hypothetical protein [Shinella sp.]
MSSAKKTETTRAPAPDLVSQYRPLGLKAVLAAALQIKRSRPLAKPAKVVA